MRMVTRRLVVVCMILVLPFGLAGCTPPTPTPTSSATPTTTPAFASDEAALKAATAAYAAYLKMSDTIAQEGGIKPERFSKVAEGPALASALRAVEEYSARKLHTVGFTTFDSAKLQSWKRGGLGRVTIYLCDDVSGLDVIDSGGKSVVQANRKPRTPFEVTVTKSGTATKISDRTLWERGDVC